MRAAVALIAIAIAAPAAATNLLTNGSFETGPAVGGFTTLGTGNTAIAGWTVTSGSIDYIGTYWNASNGSRSIDLNGGGPGAIAQSFATLSGRGYRVTFDLAANPDNAITKLMRVSAGNASSQFLYDGTPRPLRWTGQVFNFTALGGTSTLTFAAVNSGAFGAALDNVAVSLIPVPEPASWAMLIAGFGLVGAAARRGRSRAVAA